MSDAPLLSVDANGWVREARHAPSPNFEARPAGAVPTLVVVHNISLPPGLTRRPENPVRRRCPPAGAARVSPATHTISSAEPLNWHQV